MFPTLREYSSAECDRVWMLVAKCYSVRNRLVTSWGSMTSDTTDAIDGEIKEATVAGELWNGAPGRVTECGRVDSALGPCGS